MSDNNIYVQAATEKDVAKAVAEVFLEVTDNLAWLKSGDKVLLKPALNSPDPYPSTTHPLSVKTVAKLIEENGGRVIIADQSGIEHVLHGRRGVVRGSSRDCYRKTGMMAGVGDRKFVALEKTGWRGGFKNFQSEKTSSWPEGFYITKLVDEVDHIVNLPRLSTHAQAGVTLGFKNLVGLLREDSRILFHSNGPFHGPIKKNAGGSGWEDLADGGDTFFEKITEIYSAVADKMRATLFAGTKAQLTFGPDKYVLEAGLKLASYQHIPDPGLVFASTDPVAAEAYAIAVMTIMYREVPFYHRSWQKFLLLLNGQAKELGKQAVAENPFVKHALSLNYGNLPGRIVYDGVSASFQKKIGDFIS